MNRLEIDGLFYYAMQLLGLIGMVVGLYEDMVSCIVFSGVIYLAYIIKEEHRESKETFMRLLYGKIKDKQESNGR